jgi:hypothetical protein
MILVFITNQISKLFAHKLVKSRISSGVSLADGHSNQGAETAVILIVSTRIPTNAQIALLVRLIDRIGRRILSTNVNSLCTSDCIVATSKLIDDLLLLSLLTLLLQLDLADSEPFTFASLLDIGTKPQQVHVLVVPYKCGTSHERLPRLADPPSRCPNNLADHFVRGLLQSFEGAEDLPDLPSQLLHRLVPADRPTQTG